MAMTMAVKVEGENEYEFAVLDDGTFSLDVRSPYDGEDYVCDMRISARNLTHALEQVADTLRADATAIENAVKALAKVTE